MLWTNFLDVTRSALFVLAHWCGGSFATAILIGSAAVRVAMLPLTLRSARRRLAQERTLAALAPEFERIKKRYATQPALMMSETQKLQAAHGVSPLDPRTLRAAFLQMPPAMALYSAIRGVAKPGAFLWISDIAKPDRLLAAVAALVAAAIAWVSAASPAGKSVAQALPVIVTGLVTLAILSHLSAALALYSIANSVISGIERQIALRTADD